MADVLVWIVLHVSNPKYNLVPRVSRSMSHRGLSLLPVQILRNQTANISLD